MAWNRRRVVVSGTGSFLPNAPVSSERVDEVLGALDQAPARIRSFIKGFAQKYAEEAGIERRHFAIDPATGEMTHTVVSLSAETGREALKAAGRAPEDVQLLLLSTPLYDEMCPPTSTFLQERLGIRDCAEMEVHANCSGVGKCVQIAYDALRTGRYDTALVVYTQLSSPYLRACYYNQAKMTKTQAALRYILSDGSGALVLEAADAAEDDPVPAEVLGTYVESVGWNRPPAMKAGAGVQDLGRYRNLPGVFDQGTHHLDQDLAAVGREAAPILLKGIKQALDAMGLKPAQVNRLVVSAPSQHIYRTHSAAFEAYLSSCVVPAEFPYRTTGYCGGASLLVELDRLARSGSLVRGETVLVYSVESSKWMSAGFALRW